MEHEPKATDTNHQNDLNKDSSINSGNGDLKCSLDDGGKSPKQDGCKPSPKSATPTDDANSGSASPGRSSPEPSCAICLGPLENKSFTDSCFHKFCFTCLLSWSKVKAECPLCKQKFKSIVHNVRSFVDYDQYFVPHDSDSSLQRVDGRRFRYSSTLTAERVWERRHRVSVEELNHQTEYQRHRLIFAPHSVPGGANRPSTLRASRNVEDTHSNISSWSENAVSNTSSQSENQSVMSISPRGFRHRVYSENLWVVQPQRSRHFRCASSGFYRQNPACTHRLIPWLNRELLTLLHNSETRVMFVMDLILALIMRYDIKSEEFHIHMQPYLGDQTAHFVHEFYNYASSPYDMLQYDNTATYERMPNYDDLSCDSFDGFSRPYERFNSSYNAVTDVYTVLSSSPGSDVIPISSNEDVSVPAISAPASTSSSASTSRGRKKKTTRPRARKGKRVSKICLKRNQNNSWDVKLLTSENQSAHGFGSDWISEPGPSTSRAVIPSTTTNDNPFTSMEVTTVQDISSGDDDSDQCVVVNVIKPRHERTPEIIDIASSDEERISPLPHPSSSQAETSNGLSLLVSASEMLSSQELQPSTSGAVPISDRNNVDSSDGEKPFANCHPLDLSMKGFTASMRNSYYFSCGTSEVNKRNEPCTYLPKQSSPDTTSLCRTAADDEDNNHWYSDSTDVLGDNSDEESSSSGKNKLKKSRLRSVVASVSLDSMYSRSDSSHHSSHSKKHKHKKKKHKCKRHSHSREKDKDKET